MLSVPDGARRCPTVPDGAQRCPTVPDSGVLVGNAGFRAVFIIGWWRIVPWL